MYPSGATSPSVINVTSLPNIQTGGIINKGKIYWYLLLYFNIFFPL